MQSWYTLFNQLTASSDCFASWFAAASSEVLCPCLCRRESYHHMCRYFSGFFYHHPLLADVDYYWRIEPDVHYYCDLDYDPFVFMQQRYGLSTGHAFAHVSH